MNGILAVLKHINDNALEAEPWTPRYFVQTHSVRGGHGVVLRFDSANEAREMQAFMAAQGLPCFANRN